MKELYHCIFMSGLEYWFNKNGNYNREDDGPSRVYADGTEIWYKNTRIHRDKNPAIARVNGNEEWYDYGQFTGNRNPQNGRT